MFNWSDYINGADDLLKDLPWNFRVDEFVKSVIRNLDSSYRIDGDIAIHASAVIEEGVVLKGPIVVGPNCFLGAHAYLRGGVYLIGKNSVGPGCELKSCILFPSSNLAHFNFIGDSIVGSNVNFEAGAIVANHYNERTDKEITVSIGTELVKTNITKFGAVIGDGCKIGANAVLSPGTILDRNTVVARQELVNQDAMTRKKGIQWRELFVNKAFDLTMVILGVSIAFQLNNWKGKSDQESLEKFYKESFLADVNKDIREMHKIMKELESDRQRVESYLPAMDKLPADSLIGPLVAILSLETFTGSPNTYETLVAGAGLNTFGDRDLVAKLTAYYSSYTAIRRFESVYTQAIFELNNHFSRYVVYDQGKIADKTVVLLPATRNYLTIAGDQLNTGLEDYGEALSRAEALKIALEKTL